MSQKSKASPPSPAVARHQPDRPRVVEAEGSLWIVGFDCGVCGPYTDDRDGRAEVKSDFRGLTRFYRDEENEQKTGKK